MNPRRIGVVTHGKSRTKIYQKWLAMKSRCEARYNVQYDDYGGRGIKVCDRWKKFENFYMDMNDSYEKHFKKHGQRQTTLERLDVDADYSPENCIWADYFTQQNNRRNNKIIELDGVKKTLSEWSREKGLKPATVSKRIIVHGWTEEQALNIPVIKGRPKKDHLKNRL